MFASVGTLIHCFDKSFGLVTASALFIPDNYFICRYETICGEKCQIFMVQTLDSIILDQSIDQNKYV